MTDRPSFELSIDTRLLYDMLISAQPGETVTFKAMAASLGRPLDGGSPHMQSALRRAFRDGDVFDNVRRVGYRKLTDSEIVKLREPLSTSIRRRSRRAAETMTKVKNFDALSPDEQVQHNAGVAMFSTVALAMKPAAIKAVESAVRVSGRALPFAQTLEAFKAAGG